MEQCPAHVTVLSGLMEDGPAQVGVDDREETRPFARKKLGSDGRTHVIEAFQRFVERIHRCHVLAGRVRVDVDEVPVRADGLQQPSEALPLGDEQMHDRMA
ncbi:Uncharacterised protein [Streptococcus pneumoniae]|nr:Uncharacterised protein [Streptococcus pneumoniae]